ncbi:MAG: hypothetical protein KIS92_20955 [Planctomycetota bacterium]|nr:hypothetical protein [Planctomycetota bacterium]
MGRNEGAQGLKRWPRDFEEKDIRIMYGRIDGGMFVGLQHEPTGVTLTEGPLKGRRSNDVLGELQAKFIQQVRAYRQKQPASPKRK